MGVGVPLADKCGKGADIICEQSLTYKMVLYPSMGFDQWSHYEFHLRPLAYQVQIVARFVENQINHVHLYSYNEYHYHPSMLSNLHL